MSKIDPNDAPAGFVAVAPIDGKTCKGCAVHQFGANVVGFDCGDDGAQCMEDVRADRQRVIFAVRPAIQAQPAPKPNNLPAVWDLVLSDMAARDKTGRERYGVPLQPHNGRDALVDAYQEALDLAVYLRQAIYERDGK